MTQEQLIAEMVKEDLLEKAKEIRLQREAERETPVTVYVSGGTPPKDVVV